MIKKDLLNKLAEFPTSLDKKDNLENNLLFEVFKLGLLAESSRIKDPDRFAVECVSKMKELAEIWGFEFEDFNRTI